MAKDFVGLGETAASQLGEMLRWWYRTHRNTAAPSPRQPVIRGGSGVVAYRITAVPDGGRREYQARKVTYVVSVIGSENVLTTSGVTGDPITVYNILESTTDGPTYRFLVIGDEIGVWQQDGLNLCCEVPRGFN